MLWRATQKMTILVLSFSTNECRKDRKQGKGQAWDRHFNADNGETAAKGPKKLTIRKWQKKKKRHCGKSREAPRNTKDRKHANLEMVENAHAHQ